jgi:choice-of-anchor A domain-containing protein
MTVVEKQTRLRRAMMAAVFAVPVVVGAPQAMAATITAGEILDQFNAVVTGDFQTSADVEGRLVAGTIKNGQSSTYYLNPRGGASSFQAINALTIQSCPNCNVNNGGSVNYVNSNAGNFNFNGGGSVAQDNPSFSMSDFTTPLNALEKQLGALSSNSTVNASDPNNFTFNLSPVNNVAVFNVTVEELSTARNFVFSNLSSKDTIIINVTDATPGWSYTQSANFNAPSSTFNSQTIWNFEGATSLNLTYWHGAVLAGDAAVTNSSPIEGMLYAASFNGHGELHDYPFTGTLPGAVPEPSTWAMMGLGFAGLGFLGLRSRKSAGPRAALA